MDAAHSLLRHLDHPIRFLSFSARDVAAYAAPIFLGALSDSLFLVPLGGILAVTGVKRLLKKFPKHYVIRYLYWSLPTSHFNRMLRVNLPPSNARIWVK